MAMTNKLPETETEPMINPPRPSARGLYDPSFEHDSCGVGFVARLDAQPDHGVIRDAVEILVNLRILAKIAMYDKRARAKESDFAESGEVCWWFW